MATAYVNGHVIDGCGKAYKGYVIVDGDNGHEIRRSFHASHQRSQIDGRGFKAIEKPQPTMIVPKKDAESPDRGQGDGEHGLEMAPDHSWLTVQDGPSAPTPGPEPSA